MNVRVGGVSLMAMLLAVSPSDSAVAYQPQQSAAPRETRIPVGNASLYARDIGQGPPIIVLHGGPDFDHGYLVPDLDRLADGYHLIYYDQRGRGKSADGVAPDDVTLTSDVGDVESVRQYFKLESPALLGHSWGAVLALEYAVRHPASVSRLILMNPAPASADDLASFRTAYARQQGAHLDRQKEIIASSAYQEGDPDAVAARYRIHFKDALRRPEDYAALMARMRAGFVRQGKEGVRKAQAIEDQLMRETWEVKGYDLMPALRALSIPTLVISCDADIVPHEIAEHIARAVPNAELVMLTNCGHFAYLECPGDVHKAVDDFFRGRPAVGRQH